MKKAIIILTILLLGLTGFCVYEGKLYIDSVSELSKITKEKSSIIDEQLSLTDQLNNLKQQFEDDSISLLDTNIKCKLWKNQDETLKKIIE